MKHAINETFTLPLGLTLAKATRLFETEFINRRIAEAGNPNAAAALLGVERSNLYRKIRQLADDKAA